MREELIGIDRPAAWEAALDGVPHGFDHSWAACHAAQLNTGWPTYLYCAERDGVRVLCPFSERRASGALDLVTPRGFSGFAADGVWPGFAEHWRAFAAARGAVCGYLAQHPEFGQPEHEGESVRGSTLYFLDLHGGAASVIARARKGRRRELRVWRAGGNDYVFERARLRAFALDRHAAFMAQAGASAAARLNEAALLALADAPGAVLLGAGPGNDVIEAVLLCAATRWGAEGVFNVSTPEGRRHTVPLLARAVEFLAAQGVPWLNLGGGAREGDAIAAAKRQWNPRATAFRRLLQVYRVDEYERLCAQAGVDPDARDGYFPPYLGPAPAAHPRS